MDSKSRDSLNHPISLKVPVNPPYLNRPKTPLNTLGLELKDYYMTCDVCKVLNIKTDTFRYRIRAGFYPETQKIAGKRIFTMDQIKDLIKITDNLIRNGVLSAGTPD